MCVTLETLRFACVRPPFSLSHCTSPSPSLNLARRARSPLATTIFFLAVPDAPGSHLNTSSLVLVLVLVVHERSSSPTRRAPVGNEQQLAWNDNDERY